MAARRAADAPPLTGLKILDFTRHLAGPFATTMLGDYGADVVKVESMPAGDPVRRLHSAAESGDGDSLAFVNYNHGKRSIALDLRTAAGVDVVKRLARDADVVVENYRPGVTDEIGIGYDDLRAMNPRIIYCSVSAFGQEGPWSRQPATDPVVQAMAGLISVTGFPGQPVRAGVPMADVVGGLSAVQGILLALQARERTGIGQWVDVSMLHALLQTHTTRMAEYFATGNDPSGQGNAHTLVAPYETFETADGVVIAGSWAEDTWPRFCRALGKPELIEDERFGSNVARVRRRAELSAIIAAEMRLLTTAEWEIRFHEAKALFGPVLPLSGALRHEQLDSRPAVVAVDHPELGTVEVPNPASAVVLHGTPGGVRLPPPLYGEHGRDILAEAGYDDAEIGRLLADGVIGAGEAPPTFPVRSVS
jgi:crotonobetainyl-CoA:carnitine CoA-transferase CaiB-like acyl-CoA transferase